MKVEKRRTYTDSELQLGDSTWNENERSVRCVHKNSNGGFRLTSPEVPMEAFFEMMKFVIEENELSPKQLAELRDLLN